MGDREVLLQLAERCEKATGADRALDAAIADAVPAPNAAYTDSLDRVILFLLSKNSKWAIVSGHNGDWMATVRLGRKDGGWLRHYVADAPARS